MAFSWNDCISSMKIGQATIKLPLTLEVKQTVTTWNLIEVVSRSNPGLVRWQTLLKGGFLSDLWFHRSLSAVNLQSLMDRYLSVSLPAPVGRTEQDQLSDCRPGSGGPGVCTVCMGGGTCGLHSLAGISPFFLGLELCVTTRSGEIYRPHILQLIWTIVSMLIPD